jgi:hypothetical protein
MYFGFGMAYDDRIDWNTNSRGTVRKHFSYEEGPMLKELNSPFLYLICGGIIAFVAVVCVIFLVRAYRAGIAIGMDRAKLKRAITSSITFSILPSVGILLGVIALSGSLGTPWPWLRLSVIGALHYETQVAEAVAEQVGIGGLSASSMTPKAFDNVVPALASQTSILILPAGAITIALAWLHFRSGEGRSRS